VFDFYLAISLLHLLNTMAINNFTSLVSLKIPCSLLLIKINYFGVMWVCSGAGDKLPNCLAPKFENLKVPSSVFFFF
jgi:hypothetical protein